MVVIAVVATLLIVFLNKGGKPDPVAGGSSSSQTAQSSSQGSSNSGGGASASSKSKSSGGSATASSKSQSSASGAPGSLDLEQAKSDAQTFLDHLTNGEISSAKDLRCSGSTDGFQQEADKGTFAKAKGRTYTVTTAEATGAKTAKVGYTTPDNTAGVLAMSMTSLWWVCPTDQPGVQDLPL